MADNYTALFEGYAHAGAITARLIDVWRAHGKWIEDGKRDLSIQFIYRLQRHAFRIETPLPTRFPRIVIYSGSNDPRRGSPLIKGADRDDLTKLKTTFGFSDVTPDWSKLIDDSVSDVWCDEFIGYAFRACQGK